MTKKVGLFLVMMVISGCSLYNQTENSNDTPKKNKEIAPIAIHDAIPEDIALPRYPEEVKNINVKEYDEGYIVEMTAPNPLIIAQSAWMSLFQEQGWSNADTYQSEKNTQWNMLIKNDKTLFIHFEEIFQIIETEEEAEPTIKGETRITTYIKK